MDVSNSLLPFSEVVQIMIGSLPNELENGEDVKVKGVRKVGGAGKRIKERLSSTRGNFVYKIIKWLSIPVFPE